jgi:hypothetical protein
MPRLLKRWYVWLGLVLLLGLAGSTALIFSSQSRITQANFERIQKGMNQEEVSEVLGKGRVVKSAFGEELYCWENGPHEILVWFSNGRAKQKRLDLATAWESLQWYAKKGAAKVGIKWD